MMVMIWILAGLTLFCLSAAGWFGSKAVEEDSEGMGVVAAIFFCFAAVCLVLSYCAWWYGVRPQH